MCFECVQELSQYLILGFLAFHDIWVFFGIIHASDVLQIEDATPVLVHDPERLLSKLPPEGVHLASDAAQELLVVDAPGAVAVEDVEEAADVALLDGDSEVFDGLGELIFV
jgi:hypothetical protein